MIRDFYTRDFSALLQICLKSGKRLGDFWNGIFLQLFDKIGIKMFHKIRV